MKKHLIQSMLVLAAWCASGQGFIYDQQSAASPVAVQGNGNADGLRIQENSPLYQSFTPSLSAIGFVSLEFWDIPNNGNYGATAYVKLWTGSSDPIRATTLVGSTLPVYMPNGFANSGLGIAGITNFNFSLPIALTPGQTYYLQPIVLSGDNPWDIITIGDTYSNGQLFEGNAGFRTDMWFREGVVSSVPEPSTLAFIGVSCLLVFIFKRRVKLVGPLLLAVSFLSAHAVADSVVQATADEAGLTSVSSASLPRLGTFLVMTTGPSGQLTALPYPFLPPDLSDLAIFSVTNNVFIVTH